MTCDCNVRLDCGNELQLVKSKHIEQCLALIPELQYIIVCKWPVHEAGLMCFCFSSCESSVSHL